MVTNEVLKLSFKLPKFPNALHNKLLKTATEQVSFFTAEAYVRTFSKSTDDDCGASGVTSLTQSHMVHLKQIPIGTLRIVPQTWQASSVKRVAVVGDCNVPFVRAAGFIFPVLWSSGVLGEFRGSPRRFAVKTLERDATLYDAATTPPDSTKMLEGVLANFLNRTIGQYVENLEYSQLNVGVWKGDVVLKDLRLRKDALDRFELPIDVLEGYLGELTLKVPWSDLGRSPVRIYINNLFLLATPKAESSFDAKAEEERLQKSKMNKLETLQMLSGDKVESAGTFSNF
jgi:hypothetical protein